MKFKVALFFVLISSSSFSQNSELKDAFNQVNNTLKEYSFKSPNVFYAMWDQYITQSLCMTYESSNLIFYYTESLLNGSYSSRSYVQPGKYSIRIPIKSTTMKMENSRLVFHNEEGITKTYNGKKELVEEFFWGSTPLNIKKLYNKINKVISLINEGHYSGKLGISNANNMYSMYDNQHFSISYPSKWKIQENLDMHTEVYIGSEKQVLGFTVMRIYVLNQSLESVHNESLANLRNAGFNIIENKMIKLKAGNCYRTVLKARANGLNIKQISYTLKKGGYLFNIKFGSDEKAVNANTATINKIINSLILK